MSKSSNYLQVTAKGFSLRTVGYSPACNETSDDFDYSFSWRVADAINTVHLQCIFTTVRYCLVIPTHELMLRGHTLRRIETAMQRMELAFWGTLPGHQRSLVTDGQRVITAIDLSVVEEDKKPNRG